MTMLRSLHPLVLIWLILLLLLAGTVGASFLFAGMLGLAVSLTIAAAKSGLIYWRYMHLNEEPPLLRVAALAAVAWLMILLIFLSLDELTRGL
jgi:cytochrome c oxidase subunit 4